MEEFMLSSDVLEQIKDFNYRDLTDEQSLLIDRLILNEESKERYRRNGLCKECKQPNTGNTGDTWCRPCNANHFQQNFKNWASGNEVVDEFIKKTQLEANNNIEFLEWIEYARFKNIKYLGKGGFSTIYKAFWKDGYIRCWDSENNKWYRSKIYVALKCLNDSKDITAEFLNEIGSHIMTGSLYVNRCYGITKDPKSDKLDILGRIASGLLNIHEKGLIHRDFHCDPLKRPKAKEINDLLEDYYGSYGVGEYEINKQIEEADRNNENLPPPLLNPGTNPQASKLLDFKNLLEQKNAIDSEDDDKSFDCSDFVEPIDFTKL
ncbi:kinase-like domain-containing protein [Rhizophagus irregularis DAOM 181602=DAOM 197198]|nr:kinase-like domain-containing protein [Rhizophagus irregularis DAOM 181602=DAOM 197198]